MVGITAQPVKKTMPRPPYRGTQGARYLVISPNRSGETRADDVTNSKTRKPGADDSPGAAPARRSKPTATPSSFDLEGDSDEAAAPSIEDEAELSGDLLVDEEDSWSQLSADDGEAGDDVELTDDGADGYEDEYEISEIPALDENAGNFGEGVEGG